MNFQLCRGNLIVDTNVCSQIGPVLDLVKYSMKNAHRHSLIPDPSLAPWLLMVQSQTSHSSQHELCSNKTDSQVHHEEL